MVSFNPNNNLMRRDGLSLDLKNLLFAHSRPLGLINTRAKAQNQNFGF